MRLLWPFLLGAGLCIFFGGVGYHIRDLRAQAEAAAVQVAIQAANDAYANQRALDDKEMAELRKQAANTPPSSNQIVFPAERAKRVGAIK